MAGDQDTAALMAEFLEFKAARDAAAAADNDPDNDRDVVFSSGDSSISLPWRKAREFDLDAMLESRFGLKRKAAPAAQGGGDGNDSTGSGKGTGKTGTGAQGGGQAGAQAVANLFRTSKTSKPA
jgi:hypothetical protein